MSVLRHFGNLRTCTISQTPGARRLIACRVRVRTQSGDTFRYHALVDHTCAAVSDALEYFGHWCSVSVAPCDLPRAGSLS